MSTVKYHTIVLRFYVLLNLFIYFAQSKKMVLSNLLLNNNKEVLVFGHHNADTDSVMSALIFADFLRRTNVNAKAYRLSELDNETKFILRTAGIEQPDLLPDNLPNGTQVALVDHNESKLNYRNSYFLRIENFFCL